HAFAAAGAPGAPRAAGAGAELSSALAAVADLVGAGHARPRVGRSVCGVARRGVAGRVLRSVGRTVDTRVRSPVGGIERVADGAGVAAHRRVDRRIAPTGPALAAARTARHAEQAEPQTRREQDGARHDDLREVSRRWTALACLPSPLLLT